MIQKGAIMKYCIELGNHIAKCVSSTCYSSTEDHIKAPTYSHPSGPTDDCGSDNLFKVKIQNSLSVLTYVVQKNI